MEDVEHGTQLAYWQGCKCDLCRKAHAAYTRRKRHDKIWRENAYPDSEERLARMFRVASVDTVELHGIGVVKI